jgi:hypothetical protein
MLDANEIRGRWRQSDDSAGFCTHVTAGQTSRRHWDGEVEVES